MNKQSRLSKLSPLFLLVALLSVLGITTAADKVQTFPSSFIAEVTTKFNYFMSQNPEDRVYVAFDKPMYQPGETIWFSVFVRNATTMKASDQSDIVNIEVVDPKGNTIANYKMVTNDGVAEGDFNIGQNMAGGMYTIKAYTQWQKNYESAYLFERKIQVQKVVLPRLKMNLDFEREAFGPGDYVLAKLKLNTNTNEPLANYEFNYLASLQGNELERSTAKTDKNGVAYIKYELPEDLKTNDGLLNVMIDFEGLTESVSRSVPIVLGNIDLQLLPEGGDLVNGLTSQVGFRAFDEFGEPADVEGEILDSKGNVVSDFVSYHDGMGAFSFTPEKGESYTARITKPAGAKETYELPEAYDRGYVLHTETKADGSISVAVNSTEEETLSLVAQMRGQLHYTSSFNAKEGSNELNIPTDEMTAGVLQVTLFDSKGIPRAERLVFVNADKQLNVEITSNKEEYLPREKVEMTVKVTDERGMPVPATFSIAVVDDNFLSFADDKEGNILSKLLLEPDLKAEVHEPAFYFDPEEETADRTLAMDYLMMTAGWRRFGWQQIMKEQMPVISYQPQRAILSGQVLDAYNGKPVVRATLSTPDGSQTWETDKQGKFEIRGYPLGKHNTITVKAPGFTDQPQSVYDFTANNTYYIYSNDYYSQFNFGGFDDDAELNEVMIVEEVAVEKVVAFNAVPGMAVDNVAATGVAEIKAVEKEKGNKKNKDMAPAPDMAVEMPDMDEDVANFEQAEIADMRFDLADDAIIQPPAASYYYGREFPLKKYESTKVEGERTDFRSTVFWDGLVSTDEKGVAKIEFYNSDLITSYRAMVEGIGDDGSVGRGEAVYFTQKPLSLSTKLPVEVVQGDKLSIPVIVKNNTEQDIAADFSYNVPKGFKVTNTQPNKFTVAAGKTKMIELQYEVQQASDSCILAIAIKGAGVKDGVSQEISTVAQGFPAAVSVSGQDKVKDFFLNLTNVVDGSVNVQFQAYPNVMDELLSGIESILREPYGCFEQTSASSYPNVMVLNYLKEMEIDNPELESKALSLLDQGYNRLVTFETPEEGYEWFGGAPGHEALTAYGLMQFMEMGVYYDVDQTMIDRTAEWLLEKRDGNGGFKRNPRALDSFGGADEDITNAYIVYALTEAGYIKEVQKELDAAYTSCKEKDDPYTIAMVACAMYNANDQKRGDELLDKLMKKQSQDGSWTGLRHSITRSYGQSLIVETTSFASLAMLKAGKSKMDNNKLRSAVEYIVGARSGYGGFGNTQSTIMALKAMTEYAKFAKQTDESGTIEILVNGKKVAEQKYEAGEQGTIDIEGLEAFIGEGKYKVTVQFKDCEEALPYSMVTEWHTVLPNSSKDCNIMLDTKVSTANVKVGETLRLTATVKNKTDEGQPMTMAVVGIPAGFTVQPWQLKELMEKGMIDFYELSGNNIAIYYRDMAPGAEEVVNLDLKAEIPGTYAAPASSAYLYYTAEYKHWTALPAITVSK